MKLMEYVPTQANPLPQIKRPAENGPRPQTENRDNFESFLRPTGETGNRVSNREREPHQNRSQNRSEQLRDTASESQPTERPSYEPTEDAAIYKPVSESETPVDVEPPKDEAAVEMAAVLGITIQELQALFAEQGIDADLAEGLDKLQIGKIIQATYNPENPVDLLRQPEALETAKKLDELVKAYISQEANKVVTEAEVKPVEAKEVPVETLAKPGEKVSKLPVEAEIVRYEYRRLDAVEAEKPFTAEASEKADLVKTVAPIADDGADVAKQSADENAAMPEKTAEGAKFIETGSDDALPLQTNAQPAPQAPQAAVVSEPIIPNSTADSVEVVKQLTEQIKVTVQPDSTELRLTLKPESLGEVTMRIISHNGAVTAQFFAESQRIKEIIESSLAELKNALTEKGLEVSEMSAFVGDENNGDDEWENAGRSASSSRISRIMRRNGMEAAAEDTAEEISEAAAPKNPLEVDFEV